MPKDQTQWATDLTVAIGCLKEIHFKHTEAIVAHMGRLQQTSRIVGKQTTWPICPRYRWPEEQSNIEINSLICRIQARVQGH